MAKVINHFLPKPPNLGTKTVTENGTVTAASEGLDGFSQVTVNVASSSGTVGAGDDRISLLTAENAGWSRIVKSVDVETDKYFGFSGGSLPENASSAAWLKIGSDVIATSGIQAKSITTGVNLVILQNQEYNKYQEVVEATTGYYFYLIGKEDAVLTYLQSVQSENPDYLRWYADDGSGGLGTLIYSSVPFYNSSEYLVSQFYEIEYQEEGWYRNLTTFFNAGSLIPNTYLENITFRADGIAYNGAAAWTGETSAFNREASLSENEKVIIYNGKYWSNSEYINDATDGFYDENGSCIIVWFNPCDFYLENRNAGEITRYELHAPLTINDDENITRVQYSNKGYLLGLPASDAADTLHSDTHIVGTISIYGTVNNVTTYTAIFDYPVGKSYMQAVLTLASGYLYIRIADNAICNGSNGAFSVSAGNSAIVAFLLDADDFSDDSIDIATCKSFDALKDKMSVIINIPSFANQTYIEPDKTPVAADLLSGKEAWANGVKIVGEGTAGGGSGWQPDPLWTDIRTLWDEDTLRKKVASGVTFYSDTALTTSVGTLASSHSVTSVESTYGTIVGDGTDGTAGTTYYVAIADVTGDYIYSAIYLILASDLTTVFTSGARYITSDGYDSGTVLASDYTHTWDLDDDMIDSNGAYTRWIKVYAPTNNFYPNFNYTQLWVIWNLGTTIDELKSSKTLQACEIKSNVTTIAISCFNYDTNLEYIAFPETLHTINGSGFYNCFKLNIEIPETILYLGSSAFRYNYNLKKVKIAHGVTLLNERTIFNGCSGIKTIELPNTLTDIENTYSVFTGCSGVTSFILEENFDADLKVSNSDLYSRQVLNAMIAAYKDNSGEGGTARTLTIGTTNLAKLTAEDIAVATAKNLTLA